MTLTEQVLASRESRSTASVLPLSALSLVLAASQYRTIPSKPYGCARVLTNQIQGSGRAGTSAREALDLVRAFHGVYDTILANEAVLDPEIRDILYKNLWSLYE